MGKYIPVEPEKWAAMVQAQSDLPRWKEMCDELDARCNELKAEVEQLRKFNDEDTCPHLVRASLLEAENARLKAEVERLRKFSDEALAHIAKEERKSRERLDMAQAEVERLRKAGDAVCESPYLLETDPAVIAWRAAKEGKPSV